VATSTGRNDIAGVLSALGAAALHAVGVLLQKRAIGSVGAFAATWLGCVSGTIVCSPFAPTLLREAASAPASASLGVVSLGLFPTALALVGGTLCLAGVAVTRLGGSRTVVAPSVSMQR
jgi:drug/metabolite transporter (DMT)-like permease